MLPGVDLSVKQEGGKAGRRGEGGGREGGVAFGERRMGRAVNKEPFTGRRGIS